MLNDTLDTSNILFGEGLEIMRATLPSTVKGDDRARTLDDIIHRETSLFRRMMDRIGIRCAVEKTSLQEVLKVLEPELDALVELHVQAEDLNRNNKGWEDYGMAAMAQQIMVLKQLIATLRHQVEALTSTVLFARSNPE